MLIHKMVNLNTIKPILWLIISSLILGVTGDGATLSECKFESDICDWIDNNEIWTIGSSVSDFHNLSWTPIQGDHDSGSGGYLFVDPVKISLAKTHEAILSSPQLTGDETCLTFWYYMFGLESGYLGIDLEYPDDSSTSESTIWEQNSNHGRRWIKASVDLFPDSSKPWIVSFHAKYSKATADDEIIALDDIKLTPGSCTSDICDFEASSCSMSFRSFGKSSWETISAGNLNNSLITTDHTDGTPFGHFAYVKGIDKGDIAILTSVTFNQTGYRCLRFWYTSTTDDADFYVSRTSMYLPATKLWTRNRDHYGIWRQAVVNLPEFTIDSYMVEFRIEFSKIEDAGEYAIDDISIEPGYCPDSVDCDFTSDTCLWATIKTDETFDWIRMTGNLLPDSLDGPGKDDDETDEDDFYLFAYFDPSLSVKTAIIDSGDFDSSFNGYYCLMFNLFAVNREKLGLIIEMWANGDEMKPILSLMNTNLPEKSWAPFQTQFYLDPSISKNDFHFLRLRATYISEEEKTGPDGQPLPHPFASLAIDDIIFSKGVCDQIITAPPIEPTVTSLPINNFACDFESDLCDLINDNVDSDSLWYRRSAIKTKTDGENVPSADHTYNDPSGHFLFSKANEKNGKTISELSTRVIEALGSVNGGCLSFWYYIRGTKSSSLSIQMITSDSDSSTIWQRSNIYGDNWYHGYVNIKSVTYDYNLTFIANHANDYDSGIALDDISYIAGSCSFDQNLCDFESGSCGYDNGNVYNEIWKLVQGSAFKSIGSDYSTQTAYGSFILAQKASKSADSKDGLLIYDKSIDGNLNCIQFATNIQNGQLSLMIGLDDDVSTETIWSLDYSPEWTLIRLPLPYSGNSKSIIFSFTGKGYGALDDISFSTECQPLGYCNFENDFCGWTTDDDSWSTFKRYHGRTENIYSPAYDITTRKDSGSYAMVSFDATKSKKYGNEKYSLISPLISIIDDHCLSFWYYENGKDSPTLHVLLNEYDSDGQSKTSYLESIQPSSRLDMWTRKSIEIDSTDDLSGKPFTIEFRATVKSSTSRPTLVAIDDIELYPGICSDSSEVTDETIFWCDSNTNNITGNLICDFYSDCEDSWDESKCGFNCDFETGSCGWTGGVKNDAEITIVDTSKKTVEPNNDATFNIKSKGSYWKLNTKTSTNLVYLSPVMRNSAENCYIYLSLYMVIQEGVIANDMSKQPHLTISIVDLRSTLVTQIHNLNNNLGQNWHSIKLYIGRNVDDFQIRIEVRTKKGSDSIAIDEIHFDPECAVPRIGEAESCSSNEFFCSRMKRCIDLSLTCDYRDDCGDGEDEEDELAECNLRSGRCDFDQGSLCDWSTELTLNETEKWRIIDYDDVKLYTGSIYPTRDHTLNNGMGKFAINTGVTDDKIYSLTSPSIFRPDIDSVCTLSFYYQFTDAESAVKSLDSSLISNNYIETQIVLPHLTNSRNTLETIQGSYSLDAPHFKRSTIKIGPEVIQENRLFQLSLLTVHSQNSQASWAIDDISFSSDCGLADCYLRCQNEFCVSLDHRCDFIKDCIDEDGLSADEDSCTASICPFGLNDICNWEIILPDDLESLSWKLYQPETDPIDQSSAIAPKYDATNKDSSGWLLLFDSRDINVSGQGQLWSQMIGRSASQCSLKFNYFCNLNQCDLTIYLETDIDRPGVNLKRLWEPLVPSSSYDSTAKWRSGLAFIGATKYSRILITASSDFDNETFTIGLDDLNFIDCVPPQSSEYGCDSGSSFQCANDDCIDKSFECDFVDDCLDGSDENESCESLPGRCDFETSCLFWNPDSFRIDRFSSLSWAQTPDLPSNDHTLGVSSGTYLSLSGSRKPVNVQARHYSQVISGSKSSNCMVKFWLNIIDFQSSSELVVYQRFDYSSSGYKVIGRISVDFLGDCWKRYTLQLPGSSENYQIVLEGLIGKDNDASINIDDLTLTKGCYVLPNDTLPGEEIITTIEPIEPDFECYTGYKPCLTNKKCYPVETECDFKDDCGDGTDESNCPLSCSFENGWCKWYSLDDDNNNNGKWIIQKASESELIRIDHTNGDWTGSYGLASFNSNINDVSISLNSPNFTSSGQRCTFSFYYFMTSGSTSIKVSLYQNGNGKSIYSVGGSWQWYRAYINIGQIDSQFSISIDAISKDKSTGLIAIDDILFENCETSKSSIMEDCPKEEWECSSECVPAYRLCDGFNDCKNGEDELMCNTVIGNCDFEPNSWRSTCGWFETDTLSSCSLGNSNLNENSIKLESNTIWDCESTLVSPYLPSMTQDYCHFTFQYKSSFTSGESFIKLGIKGDDYVTELQRFKGNQKSTDWTIYHIAINSSEPFQIYLTGSIDEDAVIYLKSFRLSPNCLTGGKLTLDLYDNKTEPWIPTISPTISPTNPPSSSTTTPEPTPKPTVKPTTIDTPTEAPKPVEPTSIPTVIPPTTRPEVECNCQENQISMECVKICGKNLDPKTPNDDQHSGSASILYVSFGILTTIAIVVVFVYLISPTLSRRRFGQSDQPILDDRFDEEATFNFMGNNYRNSQISSNNENLFGLSETKTKYRNQDDLL